MSSFKQWLLQEAKVERISIPGENYGSTPKEIRVYWNPNYAEQMQISNRSGFTFNDTAGRELRYLRNKLNDRFIIWPAWDATHDAVIKAMYLNPREWEQGKGLPNNLTQLNSKEWELMSKSAANLV